MAGRPRSIDDTKVFDVAKPGNAKPMGTSRPVITSNGMPIKDPTIITVSGAEDSSATLSPPSVSRKVLAPISEPEAAPQNAGESSITILHEPEPKAEEALPTAPLITKSKSGMTAAREASALAENTPAATPKPEENTVAEESPAEALESPEPLDQPAEAGQTETAAKQDPTPDDTATKPAPLKPNRELVIEPSASVKEAVAAETAATEAAKGTAEPAAGEAAKDKSETPASDDTNAKDEPAKTETDAPTGSESAGVDALAEASGKTKEDEKKADEEAKKAAALQELIDSKKYVVPLAHDSSSQKSSVGIWIALLVLIILAAGAYAAIDAKVIKTNINLPYHLFKQ
ncbi:MAG: hypothetical protein JWO47_203 [Candidatus Saccharibacteria bacterium]|nr:hypothetical protein [Candidatus Saccharibacteria bacterium]